METNNKKTKCSIQSKDFSKNLMRSVFSFNQMIENKSMIDKRNSYLKLEKFSEKKRKRSNSKKESKYRFI
jgi:hypothetical protein